MNRIAFTVTLLTDLVLSSSAANEGFKMSLDYIPGSKFLGLTARKLYSMDSDKAQRSLDLFHNGKVKFGDAHPMINGKISYPIPFLWNHPKKEGLKAGIYLLHNQKNSDTEETIKKGIQLKQAREGYVTMDQKFAKIEQNFTIKSAYDRKYRRSKDGQMFGYFSLKAGSKWQFLVDIEEAYTTLIKDALIGKQRIGRSSSAQYGLIEIEEAESISLETNDAKESDSRAFIYAYSNLYFHNKSGADNLQPDESDFNLPSGAKISWKESKIRSRIYRTWNKKRNSRNADRYIIEKGSVFVIDLDEGVGISASKFEGGIGGLKSEGFGNVLLNPSFLTGDSYQLDWKLEKGKQNFANTEKSALSLDDDEQHIIQFIKTRGKRKSRIHSIDGEVNEFIDEKINKFSDVSSSQWGQIRSIARNTLDPKILSELLFGKEHGFLYNGQSKNEWRKSDRAQILENKYQALPIDQKVEFIIKLGAEMPKAVKNQQEK